MKKLTKILVVILSVALVCTGLVMAVSANDTPGNVASVTRTVNNDGVDTVVTTEHATLEDALDALNSGDGTIKLLSNAVLYSVYSIQSNVTIDLNGCTLTVDGCFSVTKSVDFTINGYGDIVVNGVLAESKVASTSPTITVEGTKATINIVKKADSASVAIVEALCGTYTFKSVKIDSALMSTAGTFVAVDGSSAKFVFTAADVTVLGASANNAALVKLAANASIVVDNSMLYTDGNVISTIGTTNSEDVITVRNSYLKALQPKTSTSDPQSSVFGSYGPLYGTLSVVDSVIESSYRPFILDCSKIDPDLYPNMKIELKNSKIYMNGFRIGEIGRGLPPMYLDGDCSIIVANEASFGSATALSSGLVEALTPLHDIFVSVGTRVSSEKLANLGKNGLKFPDGSSVGIVNAETGELEGASDTYKFIYDPAGNLDAPYVVVALKDENGDAITPVPSDVYSRDSYDYFYFDNASGSYQRDPAREVDLVADSVNSPSNFYGNFYSHISNWWHPAGSYSHVVTQDVQSYFAYHTTNNNENSTAGIELAFGQPMNDDNAILPTDYDFVVYEIDLATDTGMFSEFELTLNSRSTATGGSDTRGNTSFRVKTDGTVTMGSFKFVSGVTEASLSTTDWNRITIAVKNNRVEDGNGNVTATGSAYLYINGELIAESSNAYGAGGYLRGMRIVVLAKQTAGRALLVDNVGAAAIENMPDTIDFNNYETVGLGMPKCTTNFTKSNITVGPIEYPTLNEAIDAAAAIGTFPTIQADIKGLTVDKDIIIITNGYTIEVTEDSYKAEVIFSKDGKVLGYDFREEYNDLKAVLHWFKGDLNNPDHYLDLENYFVTTELGIGYTPEVPEGIVFDNIIDSEGYSEKYHSGWDNDGDGKDAIDLKPLAMSDMNKEIFLYPTYIDNYFTAVAYDEDANFAEGTYKYISGDESLSDLYSVFTANPGWTLKLLSDFEIDSVSTMELATSGEAYNFDFNGNVLYLTSKGTFVNLSGGANLNVYSSEPGAMLYAIELNEADSSTLMGVGSFIKINDANASSVVSIGTVNVGDKEYAGSNLTLAGDCIVEASAGAADSAVNINGTTIIRVAYDKAAAILTSAYAGNVNVNETSFILPTGSPVVSSDSETAVSGAYFNNCSFIFNGNSNGTNKSIVKNSAGFTELKFEGCVSNGKMSASQESSIVIGNGNAAYVMDFTDGYTFADDAKMVKYNVPLAMPSISAPDFFDSENAGTEGAYIAELEGGVLRIQLWGYSISKSGAIPNGYLYVYPNAYEGVRYDKSGDSAIELPVLATAVSSEYVTVTYKGFTDNVITTEIYAKGGNIISADGIKVPSETLGSGAITIAHNGEWSEAFPVMGLAEDITITAIAGGNSVNLDDIKVSVSLYTDFGINVYIPMEYVQYITAATYEGAALDYAEMLIGDSTYAVYTVKMPSYAASKVADISISMAEGEYTADGVISLSVAEYAAKILEGSEFSEAEVSLAQYMVEYAYQATKYFKGTEDAVLKAMRVTVSDYKVNSADISELSAILESATVDLGAELAVVLKVRDDFVGTIDVMGVEFAVTESAESKILVIKGLTMAYFASDLPIKAYLADGTEIINSEYSLLDAFAAYHIENAKAGDPISENAYYLVKAFYNYAQSANAYLYANAK